jgi:hypothetical protein
MEEVFIVGPERRDDQTKDMEKRERLAGESCLKLDLLTSGLFFPTLSSL